MYRIAVMGDRDSVMGFRALGLDVFPTETSAEGRTKLHELGKGDYAVIYMTESLAQELIVEVNQYKDSVTPAVIVIPSKSGSMGVGMAALKDAVERAVGADIMNT